MATSKGPAAPYKRHCFHTTATLQPSQDEPSSEAETEMAVASGELALENQQPGPAPRGVWAGCRGDARHTQGRIDGGGGNRRGGKGKRSLGKTGATNQTRLFSHPSSQAQQDEMKVDTFLSLCLSFVRCLLSSQPGFAKALSCHDVYARRLSSSRASTRR